MFEKIIERAIVFLTGLAFIGMLVFACGIEDAYGNKQIECVIGIAVCVAWLGIIAFLGNLEAKREERRKRNRRVGHGRKRS